MLHSWTRDIDRAEHVVFVKCTNCKQRKADYLFNKNKRNASGLQSECRSCSRKRKQKELFSKEKFKRFYSACDSKLADKQLANELKEVWEIN